MDHFEVYKDWCLFLRKVYYKVLYSKVQVTNQPTEEMNEIGHRGYWPTSVFIIRRRIIVGWRGIHCNNTLAKDLDLKI